MDVPKRSIEDVLKDFLETAQRVAAEAEIELIQAEAGVTGDLTVAKAVWALVVAELLSHFPYLTLANKIAVIEAMNEVHARHGHHSVVRRSVRHLRRHYCALHSPKRKARHGRKS